MGGEKGLVEWRGFLLPREIMEMSPVLALTRHCAHLEDPRLERTRLHQLLDMLEPRPLCGDCRGRKLG
jgi:hypothetical protein